MNLSEGTAFYTDCDNTLSFLSIPAPDHIETTDHRHLWNKWSIVRPASARDISSFTDCNFVFVFMSDGGSVSVKNETWLCKSQLHVLLSVSFVPRLFDTLRGEENLVWGNMNENMVCPQWEMVYMYMFILIQWFLWTSILNIKAYWPYMSESEKMRIGICSKRNTDVGRKGGGWGGAGGIGAHSERRHSQPTSVHSAIHQDECWELVSLHPPLRSGLITALDCLRGQASRKGDPDSSMNRPLQKKKKKINQPWKRMKGGLCPFSTHFFFTI